MSNNAVRIHGIVLDGQFSDLTISKYIKSLDHSKMCQRDVKDKYNKGDTLIGEVHIDAQDYLVYSCTECGGMYAVEGVMPTLYVNKKGR